MTVKANVTKVYSAAGAANYILEGFFVLCDCLQYPRANNYTQVCLEVTDPGDKPQSTAVVRLISKMIMFFLNLFRTSSTSSTVLVSFLKHLMHSLARLYYGPSALEPKPSITGSYHL